MSRLLPVLLFALLASGCGFHLRESLSLPADLGPVQVVSGDPTSPLAESLAAALLRVGAQPAGADAQDAVRLEILSERWGDTPISIDQFGRAQEYSLRHAVIFVLRQADGTPLIPEQAVEMSREYLSPPSDALGSASERELLVREMRREMTASILRRIDASLRLSRRGAAAAPPATP